MSCGYCGLDCSCENELFREKQRVKIKTRQEAYNLILAGQKQLIETVKTYTKLRSLFSCIDPDEVDYNFHDVIGRLTDTLKIQEKFAFDLHDQGDNELDY